MAKKKPTELLLPLLVALLTVSCVTTLSSNARNIVAADEKMVPEALEKAAALGATHVVWADVVGGYSPYALGKAYRCK